MYVLYWPFVYIVMVLFKSVLLIFGNFVVDRWTPCTERKKKSMICCYYPCPELAIIYHLRDLGGKNEILSKRKKTRSCRLICYRYIDLLSLRINQTLRTIIPFQKLSPGGSYLRRLSRVVTPLDGRTQMCLRLFLVSLGERESVMNK